MESYLVFQFWRVFELSGGQILVEFHASYHASNLILSYSFQNLKAELKNHKQRVF